MAILAKDSSGGNDYEKCPVGIWPAICVDVIDLGEVETPFKHEKGPLVGQTKIQHQIQLVWQVQPEDEDGNVITRDDDLLHRLSKFYNLSLNEKATLRKDLDRWRGTPFTDEELDEGWDVERVIGVQCQLSLVYDADKDRVKVDTVLPKGRRDPVIEPDEYQREKDRPGGRDVRSPAAEEEKPSRGRAKAAAGGAGRSGPGDEEDDRLPDLPF